MMNRKFTFRESLLLLCLAVLMLALFYYFVLVEPVTSEVERCSIAHIPVEDQLSAEMLKAAKKARMLKDMEEAGEEPEGEILPYDNVSGEMHHLEEALIPASSYKLDFSNPVASGQIVRRDVSLQFDADNYAVARMILTAINESPYRSAIKDMSIVAEEWREQDLEGDPEAGDPVSVNLVITFYETLTGASTTEGLIYEKTESEEKTPAAPDDLLYE